MVRQSGKYSIACGWIDVEWGFWDEAGYGAVCGIGSKCV